MAASISSFELHVTDSALEKLKEKLLLTTYADEVEFEDEWDRGTPKKDIKRLAEYWTHGFDWREQERKINRLPQFTTTVNVDKFGDLKMHFVHQRGNSSTSIPLLFCHGWPGSFLEVEKILPLLTEPKDGLSFHVVAPSLPNFGFSERPKKAGFGLDQYAEAMHKVMLALGYDQYGGDWGFKVTRAIGIRYPDHCLASHLNMILAKAPELMQNPLQYLKYYLLPQTTVEKNWADRTSWFDKDSLGYNLLQSTKPATIGFALADSPVALLAWIYEKLHDWTDAYPWTDDEILTWISVYHFSTAGPAASARIYYDVQAPRATPNRCLDYNPETVLGLSYFPCDIHLPPRSWGRTLGPVVFENAHTGGGHFAAYECPRALATDVRTMFGPGGGASHITAILQMS